MNDQEKIDELLERIALMALGRDAWHAFAQALLDEMRETRPSTQIPICTCPSGDGSLRWPCPVHPPESVPDKLWMAINQLLDSDGSRGRFSAIQCGDAHEKVEKLLADHRRPPARMSSAYELPSVPTQTNIDQRIERAAEAVVQWLYEGMDGPTVQLMSINVKSIITAVMRGEE